MTMILRSTRVFCENIIQPADIVIERNLIVEVLPCQSDNGSSLTKPLYDLGDRLIAPGFIDLHSDAVEKEIEPRPGAEFPIANALIDLDKKLSLSGITTMFHAIAFNDESLTGQRGTETAARLIRSIRDYDDRLLAIDNKIHARYEITSFTSIEPIRQLISDGHVHMLSMMDHTPGQGQYRTLEQWKKCHLALFDLSEEELEKVLREKSDNQADCLHHLVELTNFAKEHNIIIASHDDDTGEKIDLMKSLGVTVAEFPINLESAGFAKQQGMATGMGAPNVVRGRSQGGNVSARMLISEGCCDFLCSDYHPTSMLQAVYTLHKEVGLDLSQSLAQVTTNPAKIAELSDRGEIASGRIADLVIIEDHQIPKIIMTMKSGLPIYSGSSWFSIQQQPPQPLSIPLPGDHVEITH